MASNLWYGIRQRKYAVVPEIPEHHCDLKEKLESLKKHGVDLPQPVHGGDLSDTHHRMMALRMATQRQRLIPSHPQSGAAMQMMAQQAALNQALAQRASFQYQQSQRNRIQRLDEMRYNDKQRR